MRKWTTWLKTWDLRRHLTKDTQMAFVSLEVTMAFLFQSDDERYIVWHWRDIFWSQVPQELLVPQDKRWRQMFNANISHFQKRLMMTEGAGTRHGCQGMSALGVALQGKEGNRHPCLWECQSIMSGIRTESYRGTGRDRVALSCNIHLKPSEVC